MSEAWIKEMPDHPRRSRKQRKPKSQEGTGRHRGPLPDKDADTRPRKRCMILQEAYDVLNTPMDSHSITKLSHYALSAFRQGPLCLFAVRLKLRH